MPPARPKWRVKAAPAGAPARPAPPARPFFIRVKLPRSTLTICRGKQLLSTSETFIPHLLSLPLSCHVNTNIFSRKALEDEYLLSIL